MNVVATIFSFVSIESANESAAKEFGDCFKIAT